MSERSGDPWEDEKQRCVSGRVLNVQDWQWKQGVPLSLGTNLGKRRQLVP